MTHNMNSLTIALLTSLSLLACREHRPAESAADPVAKQSEVASSAAANAAEIADLKRKIEASEQTIKDLDAVVVMERAKLDDNPDYDTSFLDQSLSEQQKERLEIEKAEKEIEARKR